MDVALGLLNSRWHDFIQFSRFTCGANAEGMSQQLVYFMPLGGKGKVFLSQTRNRSSLNLTNFTWKRGRCRFGPWCAGHEGKRINKHPGLQTARWKTKTIPRENKWKMPNSVKKRPEKGSDSEGGEKTARSWYLVCSPRPARVSKTRIWKN